MMFQLQAPIVVSTGGPPIEAIVMMTLAALTAGTIILLPLARAFARRLSGVDRERFETLERRVADLEDGGAGDEVHYLQSEMSELQERLEFAERLLAQRGQLPPSQGLDTGDQPRYTPPS